MTITVIDEIYHAFIMICNSINIILYHALLAKSKKKMRKVQSKREKNKD